VQANDGPMHGIYAGETCAHSKLGGLHSSRRYTRPFNTLSWDLHDIEKASETSYERIGTFSRCYVLYVLGEFTSFPEELHSLPDRTVTAEAIADSCLVNYYLRWVKPLARIWSGHNAEIKNEVVERVLCAYLQTHQVLTSPRDSNSQARQERKHRQISERVTEHHDVLRRGSRCHAVG
jgi:hypothetical protein